MAEISAKLVKELREKTGAGMMDCKKALKETDGDMTKAAEWLRQKGIASADKKSGRTAAEGQIGQYIHTGGRVGVLVEVNCETDFVARGEAFQELVKNVAMQVAACPNVEYVRVEDVPADIVAREKAIEMGRDDLASKKPEMREKIVEGRIQKRVKELCLLDQPFIRDQSITVEELIKRTIAQVGENIQVRRFARFVLGEGIEKEENTFADEINEQMAKMEAAAEAQEAAEAAAPEAPAEEAAAEAAAEEAPKGDAKAGDAKAKKGKSGGKKKSK
jgi:elongation factor Ts